MEAAGICANRVGGLLDRLVLRVKLAGEAKRTTGVGAHAHSRVQYLPAREVAADYIADRRELRGARLAEDKTNQQAFRATTRKPARGGYLARLQAVAVFWRVLSADLGMRRCGRCKKQHPACARTPCTGVPTPEIRQA